MKGKRARAASRSGSTSVLDILVASAIPAVATDADARVVFWNRAAENLFARPAHEVLGLPCYDVLGGRDIFGNRLCYENCHVVAMARRGEHVHGFECVVPQRATRDRIMQVDIVTIPGSRPGLQTLVHLFTPMDVPHGLTRALERAGTVPPRARVAVQSDGPLLSVAPDNMPSLTEREREILSCVSRGLQDKEIARELGLSVATVRNHVHNILEKLGVHSKLEALSLAFRQGWVPPLHKAAGSMPS